MINRTAVLIRKGCFYLSPISWCICYDSPRKDSSGCFGHECRPVRLDLVVYLFHRNKDALFKALLTERVSLNIAVTNPFPCSAVLFYTPPGHDCTARSSSLPACDAVPVIRQKYTSPQCPDAHRFPEHQSVRSVPHCFPAHSGTKSCPAHKEHVI